MNNEEALYKYHQNRLIAMIEEGLSLSASEVVGIPNTSILVKKGREEEFINDARSYFEAKYNQFAPSNYLEEVYLELLNSINTKAKEDMEDRVSDFALLYASNKDDLTRLEYLNKSLEMNRQDRAKYHSRIIELDKLNSNMQIREEIAGLQTTANALAVSEEKIINDIAEIKNKVNDRIKPLIVEEMDRLRANYKNARRGTATDFGLYDNLPILAQDKELYDNLCGLLNALSKVDVSKEIICVGNAVCVNKNQESAIKEWLDSIGTFDLLKKPVPVIEESLEIKANQKLIAEIMEEVKTLDAGREKDNLMKIVKLLNKANASKYTLVPVWSAYIDSSDKPLFELLVKDTKFFQKYNPRLDELRKTQKQVEELQNRLEALENRALNYNGPFNPDLIKIGDKVILASDKKEFEEIVLEYTRLSSLINKIDDPQIDIPVEVDPSLDNTIETQANTLDDAAKETPTADNDATPLADSNTEENKPVDLMFNLNMLEIIQEDIMRLTNNEPEKLENVASEDLEEYALLVEQQMILNSVEFTSRLTQVGSVYVPKDAAERYKEIVSKLASIKQAKAQRKNSTPVIEPRKSDNTPSGIQDATFEEAPVQGEKHRFQTRKPEKPRGKKAIKCIIGAGLIIWITPAFLATLVAAGVTPLGITTTFATFGAIAYIWRKFRNRQYEDAEPGLIRGAIQDMTHNIKDIRSKEVEQNQAVLNEQIAADAKRTRETKIMNGVVMDQDVDEVLVEIPNLEEILGSDHFTR